MRPLLFLSLLFSSLFLRAQEVHIQGYAPNYLGQTVSVYAIEDYLSYNEVRLGSAEVGADSLFNLNFKPGETRQVILRAGNNHGQLLVQPGGDYSIYFPDRDQYTEFRPNGNEVELTFLKLDSTDINYKVLGFERWANDFIGNFYYLRSANAIAFAENLDRFKANVEKVYAPDTSIYLKAYIRFVLAEMDNIPNSAERNRYEKYDHYLRTTPVYYQCEPYMTYVTNFYQKLIPRLSTEGNQLVYEAVLQSSPTLYMRALGTEYTMSHLQLRELVMIRSLAELYESSEFPKTNVLTILDSLTKLARFSDHRIMARNLIAKLQELRPGSKAPNFVLSGEGMETRTLQSYEGKHLYVHFFDPESSTCQMEYDLLQKLYVDYNGYVEFVSVYKDKPISEEAREAMKKLKWDVYPLGENSSVWKNFQINAYPHYALIDAAGFIVASPSLGPRPNGEYKTIDLTFYSLKKTILNQR
jgi:thiol-disulfide isomerase/thioredoxin